MTDLNAAADRSRLLRLRVRAETLATRIPRWATSTALLVLFAVASWLAAARLELSWRDIELVWLAGAVALGVPMTVLANATEYRHTARAVGAHVSLAPATRVAVSATAANLLPLPGGALVRITALTRSGVRARAAGSATVIAGLCWIAVGMTLAGLALTSHRPAVGAATALAGLGIGGGTFAAATRLLGAGKAARWFWKLVTIETASVLASALRMTLGLAALGVGIRPLDGTVLALSGVISNSVGIIPAGLGLKEAITAGLATALVLPASLGFVVSVLDRAVGLLGHGLLALPLMIERRPT